MYYNENDKRMCQWLSRLMANGLIPKGRIDGKSITEVTAAEVDGNETSHFFAGIGGWAEAMRIAEWPEDWPLWTGSCPCQPFSQAGKRKGQKDARHLWPEFYRLIRAARPPIVAGEQVPIAIAHGWIDDLCDDMEKEGYTTGAIVLGAHSVGAPHIRQRLFWVAYDESDRRQQKRPYSKGNSERIATQGQSRRIADGGATSRLAYTGSKSRTARNKDSNRAQPTSNAHRSGDWLGHANGTRSQERISKRLLSQPTTQANKSKAVELASSWHDVEWIKCGDGKSRPVKPGIQLLANGIPQRVAKLHGLGNAIVPQVAAVFLRAIEEWIRTGSHVR